MARGKKATGNVDQPAAETMVEEKPAEKPSNVTSIFTQRKIPEDRVFELRGKNSGPVLHSGITTKSSEQLLKGKTTKYPDLLDVGESTDTWIDGMHFSLVRTA